MTGSEYQALAMQTCANKSYASMLLHGILGLVSEAGEVAGVEQKVYQGHRFDVEQLKRELGDCLWMIAEICESQGYTIDDVMQTNIAKISERYPNGFSTERSLNRKVDDL